MMRTDRTGNGSGACAPTTLAMIVAAALTVKRANPFGNGMCSSNCARARATRTDTLLQVQRGGDAVGLGGGKTSWVVATRNQPQPRYVDELGATRSTTFPVDCREIRKSIAAGNASNG